MTKPEPTVLDHLLAALERAATAQAYWESAPRTTQEEVRRRASLHFAWTEHAASAPAFAQELIARVSPERFRVLLCEALEPTPPLLSTPPSPGATEPSMDTTSPATPEPALQPQADPSAHVTGTCVLVDGKPVAWFHVFDDAAQDWCSENYFGRWLGRRANSPALVPFTRDELVAIEQRASELSEFLLTPSLSSNA
jgi:hypothetical protein